MTKCQTLRKFWHWTFLKGFTWNLTLSHLLGRTSKKKHPVCYPSSGIFILDLIFFRAWVSTLPREDVFSCLVPASLGRWAFSSLWCCRKSTLNILFFLGHSLSLFWNMMTLRELWNPLGVTLRGTRKCLTLIEVQLSGKHLTLLKRSVSQIRRSATTWKTI